MKVQRIENESSPYFHEVWEAYRASFPPNERRTLAQQSSLLTNPAFTDAYHLDAWLDEGRCVGLMAWWEYPEYRYIEHLAVHPECRCGGYGAKIMQAWLDMDQRPAYLEIEDPVDDLTIRRRGFYLRLGFVENPMRHAQPPYDGKGDDVPMAVLSRPGPISKEIHELLLFRLHADTWKDIEQLSSAVR